MVHLGRDTIIDLVLSLDHQIDMIGVLYLDMETQIKENTIVTLVIGMGISGTEVPALDTLIMGMIGQIVDLVNNGKVKAITRTVTKVTTTIMAHEAIVRINTTSMVERDRIGVIVSMTTIQHVMEIMDANHSLTMVMVRTNANIQTVIILHCQTFLALSPKVVSLLMLEDTRFFKMPAQKSNCTYFSVNRHTS